MKMTMKKAEEYRGLVDLFINEEWKTCFIVDMLPDDIVDYLSDNDEVTVRLIIDQRCEKCQSINHQ